MRRTNCFACQSQQDTVQGTRSKALRLVFERLHAYEEVWKKRWQCTTGLPRYIVWSSLADLQPAYPYPDFAGWKSQDDLEAVLLLMRHPCLHDAGCDLLFERCFKPAVDLIYGGLQVAYLSYVAMNCYHGVPQSN